MNIRIYTMKDCQFCGWAIGLAHQLGIEPELIHVDKNHEAKQFLMDSGYTSVPQIYVDGEHIGNYTRFVDWVNQEELLT